MKKTFILFSLCLLMVSCSNKKIDNTDKFLSRPLSIDLTADEEDYFNQIFGEIIKENALTYVEKYQLENYFLSNDVAPFDDELMVFLMIRPLKKGNKFDKSPCPR